MAGTPGRNPAVDRDGLQIVNDLRLGNYTPFHGAAPVSGEIAHAPVFLTGGLDLSHIAPTIESQRLPHSPMLMHLIDWVDGLMNESLMVLWAGNDGGYRSRMLNRNSRTPITFLWPTQIVVEPNDGRITTRPQPEPRMTEWEKADEFHARMIHDVAAILTLVNNPKLITYEPATVGPHLLRRWERKPQQRIDYRVIRLPDGRLTHGRSIPVDGVPAGIALHTVRGHFATYTADAPLFGKLVGTYLKRATIRGSDRHGEVIKDYEVHTEGADT